MELSEIERKLWEGLKDPRCCNDMFHDTHSILGDERSSAAVGASENEAYRLNSLATYNKIYSAFGFIAKALEEIEKAKDDTKTNHLAEADLYYADAMREFIIAENCAAKAGFDDLAQRINEASCKMTPPVMKGDAIRAIFDRVDSTLRSEESMITELTRLDVLLEQADSIYKGLNISPGFSIGLREASKKHWHKRMAISSAFYDVLDALLEKGMERVDRLGKIYAGLMKEKAHLEEQDDTKIPEYTYIDKVKGKIKILQVETLKNYVRGVIEEDIRQQSEDKGKRSQSLDSLYIVGLMHEARGNDATAYMIYSKFLRRFTGDPTKAREVEERVDAILEGNYKLRKIVSEANRPEQTEFAGIEKPQEKITPLKREYFQERDNDRMIGDGVIPYDAALVVRKILDQDDSEGITMISHEIGELESTNQAAIKRKAQRSLTQKPRVCPYEIRIRDYEIDTSQREFNFRSWITPSVVQEGQRHFIFSYPKPAFTVQYEKRGQMVVRFAA